MIFRILLLINLISCVSGTFVVNVTQTSYQAEENHNITLEWTFTVRPDRSPSFIFIYCELITDHSVLVLYSLHNGIEVPESQHQQFSGRVQFDKDVLSEGRIRLQLSRLRTNDSGLYLCKVRTIDGWSSERCRLNVTAAWPKAETNPDGQNTTRWGRFGLYCGLVLTAAPALSVCYFSFIPCLLRNYSSTRRNSASYGDIDTVGIAKSLFTVFVLGWILENLQICPPGTLDELLRAHTVALMWNLIFFFVLSKL